MFKHQHIRKFVIVPVVTAAAIVLSGIAHAVTPEPAQQPQTEKPVDCKKNPDHERCKGKGY